MLNCDYVYAQKGWNVSFNAKVAVKLAIQLDIPIIYEETPNFD